MTLSTIRVADMHCAACVSRIEQALGGVAGVTAIHVNAARRLVLVEHGPDTDPVSLLGRIEDIGFHPNLSHIEAASARQRDLLKRLGVAGLAMMQVMMFAIALYAGAFDGMEEAHRRLLQLASLVFCIPVVGYAALPFFSAALAARRTGLNMDVPIAIAIAAAFSVSLVNTLSGRGEVYYDSVVMFTFLLLTARYVDDRLKARFDDANTTVATLPPSARVMEGDAGGRDMPLAAVAVGSRVWVEQGNLVPLDGTLVRGEAILDESALTGESVWVRRRSGDCVYAGTQNRGPGFELLTTVRADATRLAGIAELASRAQADKPAVARLADQVAGYFVPAVLLLAAGTWLAWQWVDPARGFVAALTVLVVSCPCALSLATPAAITAALTRLRHCGIVLTGSDTLERAARVDAAIVDKTGTLTVHDPELVGITWLADTAVPRAELEAATAALERHTQHPLARAFQRAYPTVGPHLVDQVEVIPGAGVTGRYRGHLLRVGHAGFCGAEAVHGHAVYLAVDGLPTACFEVDDSLRADAVAAIEGLKQAGVQVTMVSGDAPERCARLAERLGISFAARQAPETKLEVTRTLQRQGYRVLVLGDGINDVPALAAADVSAVVLESSDLVKANADALILSRRLGAVKALLDVGRRCRRVVRQNLAWALGYNLTAMPLAALGFMPPWAAALGMAGSSILVMSNAARLLHGGRSNAAADRAPGAAPLALPV